MQFHLDGFRPGDPRLIEPAPGRQRPPQDTDALPKNIDVLIVGAGPAGLTLAAQLAAFPHIKTCLVERKPGPLQLGQADGIACRTMEMFDAFGFSDRVLSEAYWVNETTFWKPDPRRVDGIVRSGRIEDIPEGLSHFPHVILNQARVHDFYLDHMMKSGSCSTPYYSREVTNIAVLSSGTSIDPLDAGHYPVRVRIGRAEAGRIGEVETVNARFVVGCDGARSVVRNAIGLTLDGASANQVWGVMDVLAVTDFPDIRLKTAIHSRVDGSILIIPREGGYLVRLYVELDELEPHERLADRNITIEKLVATAKRILAPYTFDVKEVAWWSAYEIGQRLCPRFDDLEFDDRAMRIPRIFVAGDACHTHSPKAGQGMNVSMQDTFNLGWKLASVLSGYAQPKLLHTYTAERQAVAKELIDFDREMARMFSAQPKDTDDPDSAGIDPAEFQRFFEAQGRFTAGVATRYASSFITGGTEHQGLARGFVVGTRFHSAPVVRCADARRLELGSALTADGRWRLFIFAPGGTNAEPDSGVRALCDFLADSDMSPLVRHSRASDAIDAVIDVRAIFQQDHRTVDLMQLAPLLYPSKGRYGLTDYEKAYCADRRDGRDIFDMRAIDRTMGCVVLIRPDHHVAGIAPIDSHAWIANFFADLMVDHTAA